MGGVGEVYLDLLEREEQRTVYQSVLVVLCLLTHFWQPTLRLPHNGASLQHFLHDFGIHVFLYSMFFRVAAQAAGP